MQYFYLNLGRNVTAKASLASRVKFWPRLA